MKKTTIQISESVWNFLNKKKKIGEDFNDVLKRELNIKNPPKNV